MRRLAVPLRALVRTERGYCRWNEIVSDASLGAVCLNGNASAADQKRVKMVHGVFFTPLVAALEGGLVVPSVSLIL